MSKCTSSLRSINNASRILRKDISLGNNNYLHKMEIIDCFKNNKVILCEYGTNINLSISKCIRLYILAHTKSGGHLHINENGDYTDRCLANIDSMRIKGRIWGIGCLCSITNKCNIATLMYTGDTFVDVFSNNILYDIKNIIINENKFFQQLSRYLPRELLLLLTEF